MADGLYSLYNCEKKQVYPIPNLHIAVSLLQLIEQYTQGQIYSVISLILVESSKFQANC